MTLTAIPFTPDAIVTRIGMMWPRVETSRMAVELIDAEALTSVTFKARELYDEGTRHARGTDVSGGSHFHRRFDDLR